MRTSRGYERLTVFADAVVAIAITLLVLPLVEIPSERSGSVGELLQDNSTALFAFALSFVVISRLWIAFHAIGEYFATYDLWVVVLTLLWLLTIVFLPFPTELLGAGSDDRLIYGLYIGSLLLNTCCLSALTFMISRRPELRREGADPADVRRFSAAWWSNPLLLIVALAVSVAVPAVGAYSLLLLLLDPFVTRLVLRRLPDPA